MESYDEFFTQTKLYTAVHAKPTPAQMKQIELHYKEHYKETAKNEELKMELENRDHVDSVFS